VGQHTISPELAAGEGMLLQLILVNAETGILTKA
jgi:hypothetical protein